MRWSSPRATAVAERRCRCLSCRESLPITEALRSGGLCRLCASEGAEMAWRTVYDRDGKVGEIPANLRAAYKL
jgi:hypothetical protein